MESVRQPNSRHCFVCGLENPYGLQLRFEMTAAGEVVAHYTVAERYQGFPGVVHGGITAAMLDEAAGRAPMETDPPRFMFTAHLEVRYRKNVPVGQPLRIVGRVEKSRGRTVTASSTIFDQEGTILAEADVLLVDVPKEVFVGNDLEALGWKVYDD
jgi:uncharacterized protein (TIGR00369 family)